MEMTPYQKIKLPRMVSLKYVSLYSVLLYLKGAEAFELLSDFVV